MAEKLISAISFIIRRLCKILYCRRVFGQSESL